jgi:hypothetical protein
VGPPPGVACRFALRCCPFVIGARGPGWPSATAGLHAKCARNPAEKQPPPRRVLASVASGCCASLPALPQHRGRCLPGVPEPLAN